MRYVQGSMENAVGALYVRETFAGESKQMVSAHRCGDRVHITTVVRSTILIFCN